MFEKDYSVRQMREFLAEQGFRVRRHAGFRISGDGVFQIVKWEKTAPGGAPEIRIGLQSLYSEMLPQWFTEWGCIARYSVVNFIGERGTTRIKRLNDHVVCMEEAPFAEQVDILITKAMPLMNQLSTQEDLLNALCQLETACGGVVWNDMQKFAPCLCVRDYGSAAKVVQSVLDQHDEAREAMRQVRSKGKSERDKSVDGSEEDDRLRGLLAMVESKDMDCIDGYLQRNYAKNIGYWQRSGRAINGSLLN